MVKTPHLVTQALSHWWKDESLPTLWDENEKNHPLVKGKQTSLLAPRTQAISVHWLGGEGLLGNTCTAPEVTASIPKTWDHHGVRLPWEVLSGSQSKISSLLHLEGEKQSKTFLSLFFYYFFLNKLYLETSQFREKKPHCLLPTGWTSTFPTQ